MSSKELSLLFQQAVEEVKAGLPPDDEEYLYRALDFANQWVGTRLITPPIEAFFDEVRKDPYFAIHVIAKEFLVIGVWLGRRSAELEQQERERPVS